MILGTWPYLNTVGQGCTNPGSRVCCATTFCTVGPSVCGPSVPPASFHLSSAVNFKVTPRHSDSLGTPAYVGPVTDVPWDETAVKRGGATLN